MRSGTALLLLLVAAGPAQDQAITLSLALADTLRVEISLSGRGMIAPGRLQLLRSTSRLDGEPYTIALPVTVRTFDKQAPGRLNLTDTMVAHNVRYHYRVRLLGPGGRLRWSEPDSVDIPDAELGRITGSSLLIDKLNYFLEVRYGGLTRKRYPVALGRDPRRRKLHQDNATTPEGIYRIADEQPRARYHKAFDLDYPNLADRTRYQAWRGAGGKGAGIGGEIQVHGQGIDGNWTHGCIALRNEDMDELFEHPRVGKGMPVYIVGTELDRGDIQSILDYRPRVEIIRIQRRLAALGLYEGKLDGEVGRGMRRGLAKFQRENGLPVTAQLDRRTSQLLADD
ncbi:MAG TPA: hypothetical protein ENN51_08150 [candidate division WOR-3 bacterium]|uniref:L,D-TPase catalytic domain-containing protein n=1 Tax=candidate division WOR-3 bacterium TaxID=2052148 RepID=A0A7V0XFX0_UNCW3|nr:hypothetical protein [candidate division WOR-3 bacterium]